MEVRIARCLWIVCLSLCVLGSRHREDVLSTEIEKKLPSSVDDLRSTRHDRERSILQKKLGSELMDSDSKEKFERSESRRSRSNSKTYSEDYSSTTGSYVEKELLYKFPFHIGLWKTRPFRKNVDGIAESPVRTEMSNSSTGLPEAMEDFAFTDRRTNDDPLKIEMIDKEYDDHHNERRKKTVESYKLADHTKIKFDLDNVNTELSMKIVGNPKTDLEISKGPVINSRNYEKIIASPHDLYNGETWELTKDQYFETEIPLNISLTRRNASIIGRPITKVDDLNYEKNRFNNHQVTFNPKRWSMDQTFPPIQFINRFTRNSDFDSASKRQRIEESIEAIDEMAVMENVDLGREVTNRATNSSRILTGMVSKDPSDKETSELEDLAKITVGDLSQRINLFIDLSTSTSLIVRPGTVSRVIFDVTNNYPLTIRHYFQARSSSFNVANLQPQTMWISAGQTINVAVDLVVPSGLSDSATNTVTLHVQGIETIEKSAYLYVQGLTSTITDNVRPTIDYSFNNNCAGKLERTRCANSQWSIEITVQDSDSGLQRVTSSPIGIYPRKDFISGTKAAINFYYSSTCCYTTVEITASDLLGNYNSRTIDVTAWNNLSEGEIAAIAEGVLLILLLIALIILVVMCCIHKRKSLDLPYSQRYGSRPTARAEGTNF